MLGRVFWHLIELWCYCLAPDISCRSWSPGYLCVVINIYPNVVLFRSGHVMFRQDDIVPECTKAQEPQTHKTEQKMNMWRMMVLEMSTCSLLVDLRWFNKWIHFNVFFPSCRQFNSVGFTSCADAKTSRLRWVKQKIKNSKNLCSKFNRCHKFTSQWQLSTVHGVSAASWYLRHVEILHFSCQRAVSQNKDC